MEADLHALYLRRLEPWPAAMRRHLYAVPGDPLSACFGPGDHGHWAMQANNTTAAALAVLATDPELDPTHAGMGRDEMLSWALRLIHFNLTRHLAGGGTATDLLPWGHSWISGLCLERLMHGIEALGTLLPTCDRDLLGRVLVSESDWLLDHYPVAAGLTENNRPESNIWNGCLLHRTARCVPDAPRCAEYLDKGTRFLANGISIPEDAHCQDRLGARAVADWHAGANFFSTLACNHHGYLNVGYMVICLSNLAMLHFSCRVNGWEPPEGLDRHARRLWQLVKTCTFPDGRLWRIGGDTRVRYCYCQDYAIPTWLLARDRFGDPDAEAFERGWLGILDAEAAASPGGAFLATRLADLEAVSPLYYVRLEGDRAGVLSMAAFWRRRLGEGGPAPSAEGSACGPVPILTDWSDAYHGSALVRGPCRLASWTWRAAVPPQGLCLPPSASAMAEWRGNLAGRVLGLGVFNEARCQSDQLDPFPGGFATCGRVTVHTHQYVGEGELPADVALLDLACVALPDDRTMIVVQRARVAGRAWLREVKGLFLQIPNDVFNGTRRTYRHVAGQLQLTGNPGRETTQAVPGNWLSVDDALAVVRVYGPPLCIHQPARRQIAIRASAHQPHTERAGGNLYADEICCGCTTENRAHDADSKLFDLAAVILAGVGAEETAAWLAGQPPLRLDTAAPDVRAVGVAGTDDRRYTLIANFAEAEAVVAVPGAGTALPRVLAGATVRACDGGRWEVTVPPRHVVVVVSDL